MGGVYARHYGSCWLSRGWLGSCPGRIVAFSFPALFGFGDGSGEVTEFYKLSHSHLGEFQLLFLQVAIRLSNHLLVVLEFLGGSRGFREFSDLFLDVI